MILKIKLEKFRIFKKFILTIYNVILKLEKINIKKIIIALDKIILQNYTIKSSLNSEFFPT